MQKESFGRVWNWGTFLSLIQAICYVLSQQQSFRVRPTDLQVVQGATAVLHCEVDSMKGRLQWVKDGFALGFHRGIPGFSRYSISGSVELGQHNLIIQNTDLVDDAEYQCQVGPAQGDPPLVASAHLYVMVPPDTPIISGYTNGSSVEVEASQSSLNLTCLVNNGKPAANITWYRHSQPASEPVQYSTQETGNKKVNAQSIIMLTPRIDDDQSVYSCAASHPAIPQGKTLRTYIKLSVLHEPGDPVISRTDSSDRSKDIKTDDSVTLGCSSTGGNPLATVRWYKDDQLIDSSYSTGNNKATNEYTFTAQPNDNNAVFKCEVTNKVTKVPKTATMKLKVLFAPEKLTIHGHANAKAGETITLSCVSAISNPAAQLTWIARGTQLNQATQEVVPSPQGGFVTTSNITVRLTDSENNLVYSCQGYNDELQKSVTEAVTLKVLYPPDRPVITGYSEGTDVIDGTPQTLTCLSTGGNPRATLTWWKGDTQITNAKDISQGNGAESQISILASREDNQASYRCNASNEATPEPLIAEVKMTVLFPPAGVSITTSPLIGRVGEKMTITCTSASSNPASVISWKRDQQNIQGTSGGMEAGEYGGEKTSSKIEIVPTVDDNGVAYECQAANVRVDKSVHNAVKLDIRFKPIFTGTVPRVDIIEGGSTTINVTARANPAVTNYTWYKKGQKIKFRKRGRRDVVIPNFSVNEGVLTISNVTRKDAGEYTCEGVNEEGKSNTSFLLNVQYAARIVHVQSPPVDKGKTAFLECHADANPTTANMVKWSRPGYDMSKTVQTYDAGIAKLSVYNVTRKDSGKFICTAKNTIGNATSKEVQLIVKYAPEIIKNKEFTKTAAEIGKTGRLTCQAQGAPAITFVWHKGSHAVNATVSKYSLEKNKVDATTYTNTLSIQNITQQDYGKYKCVASNELGQDSFEVTLDGTSKPDMPTDIHYVNSTHDSITITWKKGFDGGLLTKFQVRYKEADKKVIEYKYADTSEANVYTVTGLALGTSYVITVKAFNEKGSSEFQPVELEAKTSSTPPGNPAQWEGGDEVPLIVILSVCIVGVVMLACNVLLIVFFVRRRRRKMEKATDASESASQANTIEMYAPSDRPLFNNMQRGDTDNQSFGSTYDKSMDDFGTDSYRSFDDDEDIKRVFLPPQPPPQYPPKPDRYTPVRMDGSPAVDQQRSFMVPPQDPRGHSMYMDDYRGPPRDDEIPYHSGSLPRMHPEDDPAYADKLRASNLQKSLNSMHDSLPRSRDGLNTAPPPSSKTPPPPPARSSSHTRGGPMPPLPARNYTREMPRYTAPPGSTDLRPPSRRSNQSNQDNIPHEMRGHLV